MDSSSGIPTRVAIVGAGVMGAQAACRFAREQKDVRLYDIDSSVTAAAVIDVRSRLDQLAAKGSLTPNGADEAFSRLSATSSLESCVASAEVVLELVPERLGLKQKLWSELEAEALPDALLMTGTSSLVPSDISLRMQNGDRLVAINLSAPVTCDAVEVMWQATTSPYLKILAKAFVASLGMVCIETKREITGFSLNRVWRAIKKECMMLVDEGYCEVDDLDRAFRLNFGVGWGPFQLMDSVGLDVVRDIESNYFAKSGRAEDRPRRILEDLVDGGALGVKTGRGFYRYPDPRFESPAWLRESIKRDLGEFEVLGSASGRTTEVAPG